MIEHGKIIQVAPGIEVVLNNKKGMWAFNRMDVYCICDAYIKGDLDFTGDMFKIVSLQNILTDKHPWLRLLQNFIRLLKGRIVADRWAIAKHYDFDDDFYFTFLDRTRCYSQAIFKNETEPLEVAQRRKLDFVLDACKLKAGDRLLDVGGGWGALTEYAGLKGIRTTSLSISEHSVHFLKKLIQDLHLPCKAINAHFLEFKSAKLFDAVAILGVMEHLPDYGAVVKQLQCLVKPGGMVYLDASSIRKKEHTSTFISSYIFSGNHQFFCLRDFLTALSNTKINMKEAYNDYYSYFLTCKAWAEKLEAAHEKIAGRWGEALYRRFRLYLWGSAYAFFSRDLDAYRVVLEMPTKA